MLELIQLSWTCAVGDGDQGGQGQQLAFCVLDVIVVQPFRVIAKGSFDLGDDFVATTFNGESVDFGFTEQRGQRSPQVLHRYTHLRSLGAVDVYYYFRFVEREVDVDERELAGLHRPFLHPVDHLQQ
ncbi:hypothetical protein D3C85_1347990 [compost metagenome]